jgi:hypothetical protein
MSVTPGWLTLESHVRILPRCRREPPADDFPFPSFILEAVANLKVHWQDVHLRRIRMARPFLGPGLRYLRWRASKAVPSAVRLTEVRAG